MKMNPKILNYFNSIKTNNKIPNFWMSHEYITHSKATYQQSGNWEGIALNNEWLFPPKLFYKDVFFYLPSMFASFCHEQNQDINQTSPFLKYLDKQYIYNSSDFDDLSGGKWKVFRKNIRKFPKRNPGNLVYKRIQNYTDTLACVRLFEKWAKDAELYDVETMVQYVFYGENRWGLFYNNEVIGVNIWDSNWLFYNYRYCFDNGEPFLNELLRWYFYTNIPKRTKVNDGGVLDNSNLKKFKDKLNPIKIYNVYTYPERKTNENQKG